MNDLTQARKLIKECQDTQNPYLDLGKCGITDLRKLPELFECRHLEKLILSNNWWGEEGLKVHSNNTGKDNRLSFIPAKISNLTNLTKLMINGDFEKKWKIANISYLKNLTGLQSLDLSYNQISDITALYHLTGLQSLDLSYNHISVINALYHLTGLQSLFLSKNQISDITALSHLTGLQYLSLWNNQISNITALSHLTGLHLLDLGHNQISDITALSHLTGLLYLSLWQNQISDITALSHLTGLQTLYLGFNQISDITSLSHLTGLQKLYLWDNQISDITALSHLTGLQTLYLRNNHIKEIPLSIFQLNMEINMGDDYSRGGHFLSENPIESPPLEIIKQGKQSVLRWFAAQKETLKEIKIHLVGAPEAGKTSLLRRLDNNDFDKNEGQTDGVNILDIQFGEHDTFENQKTLSTTIADERIYFSEITGRFWDFGGQEIMNATHQLFLTKRSIYVLVLEARNDKNIVGQIRDWTKQIIVSGDDSPIIVVANKIDINPGFGFINEFELQKEFSQIKGLVKISCETKENIDLFKNILAEQIFAVMQSRTQIDVKWMKIKKQLKKETTITNYLNQRRFKAICVEAGVADEQEQKNVIDFLDILGLVSHFEKTRLTNFYVLSPTWVTYGAYRILTSKRAAESMASSGKVSTDDLDYIINKEKKNEDKYHSKYQPVRDYDPSERNFLIDIMHEYKLCYRVEDSYFIIPDLLDTAEPLSVTQPIRSSDDNIQFLYRYDPLPNFIMPNFMVEMHNEIMNMWRTGCVLEYDGCKALVSKYDKNISIIATGNDNMGHIMYNVRHQIDLINYKLPKKPERLIPLPGIPNGFVEYEILLTRQRNGKTVFIWNEDGPNETEFSIAKLLHGLQDDPIAKELKRIGEKVGRILDNTERIPVIESNTEAILKLYLDSQTKLDEIIFSIQTSSKKLSNEQKEMITELSEIKEKLNQQKTDVGKMQSIKNILYSIAGNFSTEIIRSVIKTMMFTLST